MKTCGFLYDIFLRLKGVVCIYDPNKSERNVFSSGAVGKKNLQNEHWERARQPIRCEIIILNTWYKNKTYFPPPPPPLAIYIGLYNT